MAACRRRRCRAALVRTSVRRHSHPRRPPFSLRLYAIQNQSLNVRFQFAPIQLVPVVSEERNQGTFLNVAAASPLEPFLFDPVPDLRRPNMQVGGQPLYAVVLLASAAKTHLLDLPADRFHRTAHRLCYPLYRLMVNMFDDVFPLGGRPSFFVVFTC